MKDSSDCSILGNPRCSIRIDFALEGFSTICLRASSSALGYCSISFCTYIWWGRVGERIRSGWPCLRAAMAITYEAITHNVAWMVAFSNPLVRSARSPLIRSRGYTYTPDNSTQHGSSLNLHTCQSTLSRNGSLRRTT